MIQSEVIETKPPAAIVTSKPEISPSKPVAKPSKQLSSVVRVVAANAPQGSNASKAISSKVQIVSSHAEIVDDTKKSLPKSIVRVEANEKPAILSSHVEIVSPTDAYYPVPKKHHQSIISSVVEIHASEDLEPLVPVENNINEPEYDLLSHEPSEFAEETYRVHNVKPSNSKIHPKSRTVPDHGNRKSQQTQIHRNDDAHPTGLVTKLGGTVVKDGATTVHETSVIGTYISGKYAQVLQSTSHIIANANKPKIAPTHSLRVLKTAAPHIPKKPHVVEATASSSRQPLASSGLENDEVDEIYGHSPKQNLVRASRRPALPSNSFKNRFRSNRPSPKDEQEYQDISTAASEHSTPASSNSFKPKSRNSNKSPKR